MISRSIVPGQVFSFVGGVSPLRGAMGARLPDYLEQLGRQLLCDLLVDCGSMSSSSGGATNPGCGQVSRNTKLVVHELAP
ncbi:MAG TPA: hypothetical protein VFE60_27980 [Roseiarcus sp.]|jgi:hypothetical protein|nr:hypothetical protein [Roseiarcus sp.]